MIGYERVLLGGFPATGTIDHDVVRYRATNLMTRLVPMPIGEPDGRTTPRLERIVRALGTAGINAEAEPRMDAWLETHAAFAVPLEQAVHAAGGPIALADDPDAVRGMIRLMRQHLAAMYRLHPARVTFGRRFSRAPATTQSSTAYASTSTSTSGSNR